MTKLTSPWYLAAHQTRETCAHPGDCGRAVHSNVLVGGVELGFCLEHGEVQVGLEVIREKERAAAKEAKRKLAAEKRAAARAKAKAAAEEAAAEEAREAEILARAEARKKARAARRQLLEQEALPQEEEYGE